jgi:hypothetical protein
VWGKDSMVAIFVSCNDKQAAGSAKSGLAGVGKLKLGADGAVERWATASQRMELTMLPAAALLMTEH